MTDGSRGGCQMAMGNVLNFGTVVHFYTCYMFLLVEHGDFTTCTVLCETCES